MIIPSIDLRDGKAVQLRQGREHVLTSERDPIELAREFNRYGPVAVVDLDAALGQGDNLDLVRAICRVAEVSVGGGIRDEDRALALLRAGARRLVIGTAATPQLLSKLSPDRVVVALDHVGGTVVDEGWTRSTGESLAERAERLAPLCSGFLCTYVEHEGGLGGLPLGEAREVRERLPHPVVFAGGVADTHEAVRLCRAGIDVQVGMALYTGRLDLAEVVVNSLDFAKEGRIPTVAQDTAGQVVMLAYSTPESLTRALREGKGIYYSRSREEIWEKGSTSGNVQQLVACRTDCDRDALLFTVRQTGDACHTGRYSCFGARAFSMEALCELLGRRREELPEGSFTASLFRDPVLLREKVLEEAREVVEAATRDEVQWETGDVMFFTTVLAVAHGLDWADVQAELRSRLGR